MASISPKLVRLRLEGQVCAGTCGDELKPGDMVGTVSSRRVCESCWNAAKWAEEHPAELAGLPAEDVQAVAEFAGQLAAGTAQEANLRRAGRPICPSCTGRGWLGEFANTCTNCAGKGVLPDPVKCWHCRERDADLTQRTDSTGHHWCAQCIQEHDAIDWGAEADKRLDQGPMDDDVDPGLAALLAAGGLEAEPVPEGLGQPPRPAASFVDLAQPEPAPVPAYNRTRQVELLGAALEADQQAAEVQEILLDALHPYAGGDPDAALADAKQVILDAINHHPRSLQRTIGPSEIGTPCQHCLAAKLAQWEQVREEAWLPTVGTAVHSWIEDAFRKLQAGQPPSQRRWLTEARVLVGHINGVPVEGSTDLVDLQAGLINDWKVVGPTTLTAAKQAPSRQYQVQQHLYAHGWNAAGVKIDYVGIAYLPRNGMSLRSAVWWKDRYRPEVAEEALAHATEVAQVLEALETISVEARDSYITGLPRDPDCHDCKRYPDRTPKPLDLTAGGLIGG